ncbi:MAG: VOC family protein [Solirubrobacteraceae bacterium]
MADQAPNIFPTMHFADANAALKWLSQTFGFQEEDVSRNEDGVIHHAEMSLGGGLIMFGQGDPASQAIYVAVEDADVHYERARAAGAEITREIEDTPYGTREYSARDIDGHMWHFGTYLPKPSRSA